MLFKHKRGVTAHISLSPSHRTDKTELLLKKDVKLRHPSIISFRVKSEIFTAKLFCFHIYAQSGHSTD